jgi:predicted metal-dependent hydrolase
MSYDRLYVEYLYYFNIAMDYYECHEVMEHLWLEEGRSPLYQGLLQIAVGLHHHQHDNVSGAIKLFSAGIQKLETFPGETTGLGIDLEGLLQLSRAYVESLEREQEGYPFQPYLISIQDPELIQLVEALRKHPPEPHEED